MEDKSDWEKYLSANIQTKTTISSIKKKNVDYFSVPEDLKVEKKDFALRLEQAFMSLTHQNVKSLYEQAVEEDVDIDNMEVLELENPKTDILMNAGEISVTNVEDSMGCAARLKEALRAVAKESNTSSVQELNNEGNKISFKGCEPTLTRLEKESPEVLEVCYENSIIRIDKVVKKFIDEKSDQAFSEPLGTLEEATKVLKKYAKVSDVKVLPSAREEKIPNGKKKKVARCGQCSGCGKKDCKICR